MNRSRGLVRAVACALVLALAGVVAPRFAHAQAPVLLAQQEGPIQSFFRQLFGGGPEPSQPRRGIFRQEDPRQQQGQRRAQPQEAAPARPSRPVAVEKDPDAQRVVVFGDFFADDLARGLTARFAQSSAVAVDATSSQSSGLVRSDHFNWPRAIADHLGDPENRVDVAVVMLGGNDRQPLVADGAEHAPRTERWRELYGERIDEVLALFQARRIPVYWVGLPPVESGRMSQDYSYFNDIYRERSYRFGAAYVDIWNAFLDENDRYSASGPDVNGEQRQLRREDGLRFTEAGAGKLAHFVARDLRRDFGREGVAALALPSGRAAGPRPFVATPQERRTGVGEVITLTAPSGLETVLAGGGDEPPAPPRNSSYYRVMLQGEPLEGRPGRTDDFAWPREAPAPTSGVRPAPADVSAE